MNDKYTKEQLLAIVNGNYTVNEETGCWEWNKTKDRNGYAFIYMTVARGKYVAVTNLHRRVYEALIGPVPSNLVAAHQCNNRCCINPDHLKITTQMENVKDQLKAKTHASQNRAKSKYRSPEERDAIYERLLAGESCYSIAKDVGSTVSAIVLYKQRLPKWLAKKARIAEKESTITDKTKATITETITFKLV